MHENWHPRKRLSQNFLKNSLYASRIVETLAITSSDIAVEIGPGRGALTEYLIEAGPEHLEVVEVDMRYADLLKERFGDKLHVVYGDFLKYDWYERFQRPVKIIGNLPYHITSPILFHVVDHFEAVHSAVFMTQKEVARRLCAEPGSKDYGILSVICQAYANISYKFTVSKGNFHPVPNVDSAVFHMLFHKILEGVTDPEMFRTIVRASFNYRRKMLRNSLSRILEKSVVYSLNAVNIDRRPENLTVEEFKQLSNEIIHLIRSANA
jgi:16S rRNA (adenine1518-N6/adenine1519-N6)-dimethyltransferase